MSFLLIYWLLISSIFLRYSSILFIWSEIFRFISSEFYCKHVLKWSRAFFENMSQLFRSLFLQICRASLKLASDLMMSWRMLAVMLQALVKFDMAS